MAAALWRARTSSDAVSAGNAAGGPGAPARRAVAAAHGLDLSGARPRHIADIDAVPDLVVSVCDRANETGLPRDVPHRHWSIPDPIGGDRRGFDDACRAIAQRVERLALEAAA